MHLENSYGNPRSYARADLVLEEVSIRTNTPTVSWGAIFAGAFSAPALSFVLLAIGTAFGLSVASPWDFTGPEAADTAAAAGIGAAIFLILVHAISSGTGGYLAGRLRPKPTGLRGDETYLEIQPMDWWSGQSVRLP
jgi:hypothetical protein